MGIQNFATSLQPLIQTNYLERRFQQALRSSTVYRQVAQRVPFPNRIGETLTSSRAGLKAPVTTPISPSDNTDLDNGLSAAAWAAEQWTLTINLYGDTIDLNQVTEQVGIANQFTQNAIVNAVQAGQTLDRLARDALFGAYLSGNTFVTSTLGSAGTSVAVDDLRGFSNVYVNGVLTPVSGTHTLAVTINGTAYTVTGVTPDGSSTSVTPGGISGTITTSANVSTTNGTLGHAVVAANGASIIRPSARASSTALQSSDYLTMSNLLDARALLRRNNVPTINGYYNFYCDPVSARQLFADSDFKDLFRAVNEGMPNEFRTAQVSDFLGLRFHETTEAYQQSLAGVGTIHRPIVVGADALIEGTFSGEDNEYIPSDLHIKSRVDDVIMITREPLGRLGQIIAQSWYWIGGYTVPSDVTTNTNIIPTATNSTFKRAVVLEHIG